MGFHPHELKETRPPIEFLPENRWIRKFVLRKNELQPPSKFRAGLFYLEYFIVDTLLLPLVDAVFWIVSNLWRLSKFATAQLTWVIRSVDDFETTLKYLENGGEVDDETIRQIIDSFSNSGGLSRNPPKWKTYRDIFVEISNSQPELVWKQRDYILSLFERELDDSILSLLTTHLSNSAPGSTKEEAMEFVETQAPWLIENIKKRTAAAAATAGLAAEYPDIFKPKISGFLLGVKYGAVEVRYRCLCVIREICYDDPEFVRPHIPLIIDAVSDVLNNPDNPERLEHDPDSAGRPLADFDTEEFYGVFHASSSTQKKSNLMNIVYCLDDCLSEIGKEYPEELQDHFETADATPALLGETEQIIEQFEEATHDVDICKWGIEEELSEEPFIVKETLRKSLYRLRRASEEYPEYVAREIEIDNLMHIFQTYDDYLIRREITGTFAAIAAENPKAIHRVTEDLFSHFGEHPRQVNENIAQTLAYVTIVDEGVLDYLCQQLSKDDISSRRLAALTVYKTSSEVPEMVRNELPMLLSNLQNRDHLTTGYLGAAVAQSAFGSKERRAQ